MNIALLQAANGDVEGPVVRVPFGNYRIEKLGKFEECNMEINEGSILEVNSKLVLSNNSSIRVMAKGAENLGVRFIREQ